MTASNPLLRARIVALWNEGIPSSEIAVLLGIARNSVIGHVYRAKQTGIEVLSHDASPKARNRSRAVQPAEAQERDERPYLAIGKLTGFTGPRARGCQWIEGDPRIDPAKCGVKVLPNSSYCVAHHMRCWIPRSKSAIIAARG